LNFVGRRTRKIGPVVAGQTTPSPQLYSIVDFPDETTAATAQLAPNAGGFARVRFAPVLSADEMDKALAKVATIRVPQQQ
jgi:hypothetical protein